ncbi:hypothetical protein BUALT_Bualt09G0012800 [Buddleja alternifolia]|uniref:Transposase n=1 Tax=Buddleja alternifolia TaxID=168488 RepID=A0AAV6X0S3_9LAMI|nr:hypothetical protein BUALT_Bualt09G0012800 [Buddleja alternifolia]
MNIGTPGDTSSHPTPSVADSTSPIFCSREETSERTMDFVDPSINEEVKDIENTDTIATDDDVQNGVYPLSVPAFDGKFDMEKVKVEVAKWIMIHQYAFSSVEDEWYNVMMKRTNPEWMPISRTMIRNQCVMIYESEKKKLKNEFKYVNKICITADCWKSKNKKLDYLVITGHWIDQNWRLADNASANDLAIENLKVFIRSKKKFLCEGSLFHVRCCAHILNLVAQDGLFEIKNVIQHVCDSVNYIWRSDSRRKIFTEIAKQLNLRERKLIDDCKTRWNSTYEMLATAVKFRDVFPRYKMMALEFFFPKLYSSEKAVTELATLYDLYFEYVSMCSVESNASGEGSTSCQSSVDARNVETGTLWSELASFLKEKQSIQPQKSELDMYLEENCFIEMENSKDGIEFYILD